ncbi:MAG: preprotein translocase subunit SecY, partial [Actinobacteria bacterium]|nr:preprotein translocase subunit SecY [Actinomycetota bacterium]
MKFMNMFKVPDLRNKILFTLFVIVLYRFGDHVYVPGVDVQAVQRLTDQAAKGGVLGFLNLFSGGGLTRLAVFGLGIMPYITSSIIIQLLMVVIPKFEQWRDEGATGQKKLTQATRYMTVALALLQSTGLAYFFGKGGGSGLLGQTLGNVILLSHFDAPHVGMVVLSMTAGTAVV